VGQPRMLAFVVAPGEDEPGWLGRAASLQSGSEHPLARAVVEAATARGLQLESPQSLAAVAGKAVTGRVGGLELSIGSRRWLDEQGVVPDSLADRAKALQADGATVSWLIEHPAQGRPKLRALLGFGDSAKPGAREAVAALHDRGIRTVMISGDN